MSRAGWHTPAEPRKHIHKWVLGGWIYPGLRLRTCECKAVESTQAHLLADFPESVRAYADVEWKTYPR